MKTGFTLIELLVVVLIIGILSAIALPNYQKAVDRSRGMAMLPIGKAIVESEQRYYLENDAYSYDFRELDVALPAGGGCQKDHYADSDKDCAAMFYSNLGYLFQLQYKNGYPRLSMTHAGIRLIWVFGRRFPECYAQTDEARRKCIAIGGVRISDTSDYYSLPF